MTHETNAPNNMLDGGTYEIIQSRLHAQKNDLQQRLHQLNAARKNVFGGIDTKLIANNRILTENNCISRDIVSFGNIFLFGYNVHFGLRTDIKLDDVFSVYKYETKEFVSIELDIITDPVFMEDFVNLYKYYKHTQFHKFLIAGNYLYMVFQLSESQTDIKAFKWLIKDGQLSYIDNRSDHEYQFPQQHDFEWVQTTRDMHKYGKHPHVSILDKVFVETVKGSLTIKVEDNTNEGQGIYNEPVVEADQTLDDGTFSYADLGNLIVLQVKPFQEAPRFFIYNHKLKQVERIDSIQTAAILLPDDHGVIFSNGYYLQSGEYKVYGHQLTNVKFQERIASPNGEDFLYVFFEALNGNYVLMQYNVISRSVNTPIICNGFTILENGELCYFISEAEQTKNHLIQIWQTPFVHSAIMPSVHTDSMIYKIGNKDIVRAMADCQTVITYLNKDDNYSGLYNDLTRTSQYILDTYYWIYSEETFQLGTPLNEIKNTANAAIDEFEKVVRLKQLAVKTMNDTRDKAASLFSSIKSASFAVINDFVTNLASLRAMRGEVISLKELRYVDLGFIDNLEKEIIDQTEKLSRHCVIFLLDEKALAPYHLRIEEKKKQLEAISKVVEGRKMEEEATQISTDLEMLIEIVSNLKIEDTSHSTQIIDSISLIFATLNQLKAGIRNKLKLLGSKEATADFSAQMKLIDQSMVNYLDIAESAEKVDELLNRISVQLEDLESKFGDYEDFTASILEKREEIYAAFEAKKNILTEARNKRALSLEAAAQRILKGITKKALSLNTQDEINGYFASDIMIGKLREIVTQLKEQDDAGKAETIETILKASREDAIRKLKDKLDLYEEGDSIIKLGNHRFSVNKQLLDLTIVYKNKGLFYHLTGTDFYQAIDSELLTSSVKYWNQALVSENEEVYRGAYLAYKIFVKHPSIKSMVVADESLIELIRSEVGKNHSEGYVKGVHDIDALAILKTLINKHQDLGLLRYSPRERAFAQFFWNMIITEEQQTWNRKIKASGAILDTFPHNTAHDYLIIELNNFVVDFYNVNTYFNESGPSTYSIANYLFDELKSDDSFCSSLKAHKLLEKFEATLTERNAILKFRQHIENTLDTTDKIQLISQWILSWFQELNDQENYEFLFEVVALLLYKNGSNQNIISEYPVQVITGLVGSHTTIQEGKFNFNYHSFMQLLNAFYTKEVPAYEHFRTERHQLTVNLKESLRLNEFEPKVLTSFVRNKLIDQIYLPLFGENLAKQLGTAGDKKRTDRSGMLLLVSPPGYGKTTLMEYLANRLGLVFMKINGPALGHDITSVDPSVATNSAARGELKKLNLALEMGNNVMLYIDDIQHCSPEFLQKFITLADGTRKIEGIYNDKPKTYDMKSKRFCVVMAGNPYTETGDKFKIPDMLANRSDIYNLGDIIGDSGDLFKLSLIENALTSNPILNELASKSLEDLYQFIKVAESGQRDDMDLKGNYSRQEVDTYLLLIDKVIKLRNTLLMVNEAYISSAAMDDAYRTEPPFKLQGSYRDMNKLVSKLVPIMNEQELQTLLLSHYQNESQTLTSAAEANMLKYREMSQSLDDESKSRWISIKETFAKNNRLRGLGKNEMAQVISQMMEFNGQVEGIKEILKTGLSGKV